MVKNQFANTIYECYWLEYQNQATIVKSILNFLDNKNVTLTYIDNKDNDQEKLKGIYSVGEDLIRVYFLDRSLQIFLSTKENKSNSQSFFIGVYTSATNHRMQTGRLALSKISVGQGYPDKETPKETVTILKRFLSGRVNRLIVPYSSKSKPREIRKIRAEEENRPTDPVLDEIRELRAELSQILKNKDNEASRSINPNYKLERYISKLKKDCSGKKMAFIVMPFTNSTVHKSIEITIKETLIKHNIIGLRADDKVYADDLFENILTYIHASDFGIAIFDRVQHDYFNPNVSLEVGLYLGIEKDICLLKDSSLRDLPVDLLGRLYKPFDVHNVGESIPNQLTRWLKDKDLI